MKINNAWLMPRLVANWWLASSSNPSKPVDASGVQTGRDSAAGKDFNTDLGDGLDSLSINYLEPQVWSPSTGPHDDRYTENVCTPLIGGWSKNIGICNTSQESFINMTTHTRSFQSWSKNFVNVHGKKYGGQDSTLFHTIVYIDNIWHTSAPSHSRTGPRNLAAGCWCSGV